MMARTTQPTVRSTTWGGMSDKVRGLVLSQVEDELQYRDYSASSAQEMATTVAERIMILLRESTQDFKLIVNATILQKSTAGMHTVSSCYWDGATDGR
jgi:dynein light chain Tctex-type 1